MSIGYETGNPASLKLVAGIDGLPNVRLSELTEMMAGLGEMAQTVTDLGRLIGSIERDVEAAVARARTQSPSRSPAARRLESEDMAALLDGARRRVGALREAVQQAQAEMGRLVHDDIPSAQLDLLRAQAQQDELRLQACEAELALLLQQTLQVGEQTQEDVVRQAQRADAAHVQGERHTGHLEPGYEGQAASAGEPPAGLRPDLDDFVRRVSGVIKKAPKKRAAEAGFSFDEPDLAGPTAELQGRWAQLMGSGRVPPFTDPNTLAQWVMRQAYMDNTQDLRTFAVRVQYFTQLKSTIRDELNRARQYRSDHSTGDKAGTLDTPYSRRAISREPQVDDQGIWHVRPVAEDGRIDKVEGLQSYISELENLLASTGDDMQMSQVELQNMMQRQQQVMNVISNLSKTLHETSMAIIRKIGT